MFVNGFLKLIEAGIIRREVYNDTVLQQMLNDGRIADETVTPDMLRALLTAGRIGTPMTAADVDFLRRFGILRAGVRLDGEELVLEDVRCSNDLLDAASFDAICAADARRPADRRHLHDRRLLPGAERLLRAPAHACRRRNWPRST